MKKSPLLHSAALAVLTAATASATIVWTDNYDGRGTLPYDYPGGAAGDDYGGPPSTATPRCPPAGC